MVIVKAINLHEKGVLACHEMTLHDLRNLLQVRDDDIVLVSLRQGDAYEGANVKPDGLRFYEKSGTGDDTVGFQTLDSLMYGSS